MNLTLFSVLCIVFSLLIYCFVQRKYLFEGKKLHIKQLKPRSFRQIVVYVLVLFSFITVMLMLYLFYERNIFFVLKRLLVMVVLWCAAISDYCELRIPNKLIIFGLVGRAILLLFEFVFSFDTVLYYLKSEGIALLAVVIMCVVCLLFSKGSLGMGDVKLLMILAIYLGIEGICYSLFITVVFSSIVAIVQLITKKKKKKDTMPFAPFILLGTIVSLILSGV